MLGSKTVSMNLNLHEARHQRKLSKKVRAVLWPAEILYCWDGMRALTQSALEVSHPVAMQLYLCCSSEIHTVSGIKHSSLTRIWPAAERCIAENLIREQGSEKACGSDTEWALLRQTQPDSWVSHSLGFTLWEVSHVSWEKFSVLIQTCDKWSSKN